MTAALKTGDTMPQGPVAIVTAASRAAGAATAHALPFADVTYRASRAPYPGHGRRRVPA